MQCLLFSAFGTRVLGSLVGVERARGKKRRATTARVHCAHSRPQSVRPTFIRMSVKHTNVLLRHSTRRTDARRCGRSFVPPIHQVRPHRTLISFYAHEPSDAASDCFFAPTSGPLMRFVLSTIPSYRLVQHMAGQKLGDRLSVPFFGSEMVRGSGNCSRTTRLNRGTYTHTQARYGKPWRGAVARTSFPWPLPRESLSIRPPYSYASGGMRAHPGTPERPPPDPAHGARVLLDGGGRGCQPTCMNNTLRHLRVETVTIPHS